MRELLDGSELSYVRCDSAGTMNAHRGNPPDPRMSAAGKRRGLPMTGSARGLKSKDFHDFDLILAMDQANFDDLRRLAPNEAGLSRVRMFCEFCREFNETEVPDPTTEVLTASKTYWTSSRTAVRACWRNSTETNNESLTNRIADRSRPNEFLPIRRSSDLRCHGHPIPHTGSFAYQRWLYQPGGKAGGFGQDVFSKNESTLLFISIR